MPTFYQKTGLVTVLFFLFASTLWCKEVSAVEKVKESSAYKESLNSIKAYNYYAEYFRYATGDFHRADSLCDLSMKTAIKSGNKTLMLEAAFGYFRILPTTYNSSKGKELIKNMINWARETGDSKNYFYSLYYTALYHAEHLDYFQAFTYLDSCINMSKSSGYNDLLAEAHILKARLLVERNEMLEAFRNLLTAMDLAKSSNGFKQLNSLYLELAVFYETNNNFVKAKEYIDQQIQLIESQNPVDTMIWLTAQFQRLSSPLADESQILDEKAVIRMMEISTRKGFIRIRKDFFTLLRSYYIENGKIPQLKKLYLEENPEDFVSLEKEDITLYYRLNALFKELDGNIDSAEYFWNKSKVLVDNKPNLYYVGTFYYRYAEFMLRQNRPKEAENLLLKSFSICSRVNYNKLMIKILQTLESMAQQRGDYRQAYNYNNQKQELINELQRKSRSEDLLMLEVEHESNLRELANARERAIQENKLKEEKVKKNAFAGGLFVFLILTGMFFRQYKLTKKQKKRSDELLLNILPEKTADELKLKGHTTAKEYEGVTVLFCDIVGFTKISEQLTAQELVNEIDFYFKAFDEIITRNGLEKIKTVGDAYLAVGGMPEGNLAEARTVALAAIEMMKFVENLKQIRIDENRPFFEIRIGLHTGPVIAGVVGNKKFQYDIWGDTVNTAARMEQTSETGHINVSGNTYEILKSEFEFTYRGKVHAKNKGMVDMYYIIP